MICKWIGLASLPSRLTRLEMNKITGLADLSGLTSLQQLHVLSLQKSIYRDQVLEPLVFLTQVKNLNFYGILQ